MLILTPENIAAIHKGIGITTENIIMKPIMAAIRAMIAIVGPMTASSFKP
jgi:hypothetical protein